MASSALFSTTAAKVFASVVLVGGAASVAGLGTFGSFTSTTSASESVTAGKVVMTLNGAKARRPVPGEPDCSRATRPSARSRWPAAADTEKFGSVSLTTAATDTSTKLVSDTPTASSSPSTSAPCPGAKGTGYTYTCTCGGDDHPVHHRPGIVLAEPRSLAAWRPR